MRLSAYIVGRQERCGSCGCVSRALYYAGESQEEADYIRADWGGGLCSGCLADWAEAEGVRIIWPDTEEHDAVCPFVIPDDAATVDAVLRLFD